MWLIVSPFILSIAGSGRWNNIIVGILVFAAGFIGSPREASV